MTVTLNSNSRHAQKMAASMLMEKFNELIATNEEKRNELAMTMTLEAVCREWVENTSLMVKEETNNNHKMYCKRILEGVEDGLLFVDFTPAIAEKVVQTMYYKEKLSFSYSSSTLTTIKAVMRYAKKAGYIDNIYDFEAIKLKRRPAMPDELKRVNNKFLNRQELKDCLEQLRALNPRVALAMEFISLTGLRCGEMLALRWQDIDFKKKLLNVNGTIVKSRCNGDEVQRGTPKNIYSYRDVDLNQRSLAILRWFKATTKKWSYGDVKGIVSAVPTRTRATSSRHVLARRTTFNSSTASCGNSIFRAKNKHAHLPAYPHQYAGRDERAVKGNHATGRP